MIAAGKGAADRQARREARANIHMSQSGYGADAGAAATDAVSVEAVHPCHESFVPFLQERVTCLAHVFGSLLASYDMLWQGHWATTIGSRTR